jgi:hypothetical protein
MITYLGSYELLNSWYHGAIILCPHILDEWKYLGILWWYYLLWHYIIFCWMKHD